METKKDLILFQESINLFFSSRLILVEKPISNILKILVSRPDYFSIIGECARTAPFKSEYKKALSHSNSNEVRFSLPKTDMQIVSLIVGLLFEFDKSTISPTDFITNFFPGPKPHDSYIKFCDNIIRPLEISFKNLYLGVFVTPPNESPSAPAVNATIPDKTKEECYYWINIMIDSVIGDNSIPETIRKDCLKLLKGFLHVMDYNDPIVLEAIWIGLYHTLVKSNNCLREIKELELILDKFGVIK